MLKPDETIIREIEEQRPPYPTGLLSRQEKDRLIERGLVGLYRWYLSRSQSKRNWNPDKGFDWRSFRTDLSDELNYILEGYYAVEQFVPDYTVKTIQMTRKSYGRSHFQIRWGSEEEKHSDVWLKNLFDNRERLKDITSPTFYKDFRAYLKAVRMIFTRTELLSCDIYAARKV